MEKFTLRWSDAYKTIFRAVNAWWFVNSLTPPIGFQEVEQLIRVPKIQYLLLGTSGGIREFGPSKEQRSCLKSGLLRERLRKRGNRLGGEKLYMWSPALLSVGAPSSISQESDTKNTHSQNAWHHQRPG
jgi:hypothetical protein